MMIVWCAYKVRFSRRQTLSVAQRLCVRVFSLSRVPLSMQVARELHMSNIPSSGIGPGQRRLNGPQTTGRDYRNLSQPAYSMAHDEDVAVPMRDGVVLMADVP